MPRAQTRLRDEVITFPSHSSTSFFAFSSSTSLFDRSVKCLHNELPFNNLKLSQPRHFYLQDKIQIISQPLLDLQQLDQAFNSGV